MKNINFLCSDHAGSVLLGKGIFQKLNGTVYSRGDWLLCWCICCFMSVEVWSNEIMLKQEQELTSFYGQQAKIQLPPTSHINWVLQETAKQKFPVNSICYWIGRRARSSPASFPQSVQMLKSETIKNTDSTSNYFL